MKTLSDLLARYKNLKTPHATIRKAFIKSVEKITDITLEEQNVNIRKSIVTVQAPSVIKNEIRLNQKEILTEVSAEVGDTHALTAIF